MTNQLDDPLDRTPEKVEAERQRARQIKARVAGRDWREVPKGYYAIPVHDYVTWMDNDCEGDVPVIGYRLFMRKEARQCKNGRVLGHNKWIRGAVMVAPGVDPARVTEEVSGDDQMAREWLGPDGPLKEIVDAIMLDLNGDDTYRAQYGKLTGKCGCCGKALTDPKSKLIGIGPDCRGYR
jgi:hypothetical protein